MRKLISIVAAGSLGLAAIPAPAFAQGVTTGPVAKPPGSNCPGDWTEGGRGNSARPMEGFCYPANGKTDNAIYARTSLDQPCAPGYYPEINRSLFCRSKKIYTWTPEQALARQRVDKPQKAMRCPATYRSSLDFTNCYTSIDHPPAVRLSKGKPCGPGEINEFGLWCTSDFEHLPWSEIESAGFGDYAKLLDLAAMEGRGYETVPGYGKDLKASPEMQAHYASLGRLNTKPAAAASSSGSSSSGAQTASSGSGASGPCGSATGAAIGGAVAGEGGAVLGSMLGGLGKKKKKSGC
ncbi:hypothetical protein [Blastomonas sp. CACIA14H2]|uniref:hypothetical protein n=1 Tax=Blastomonas sp. CACIA14H2 TaxID=1419876 RepID=UPI0026D2D211